MAELCDCLLTGPSYHLQKVKSPVYDVFLSLRGVEHRRHSCTPVCQFDFCAVVSGEYSLKIN